MNDQELLNKVIADLTAAIANSDLHDIMKAYEEAKAVNFVYVTAESSNEYDKLVDKGNEIVLNNY